MTDPRLAAVPVEIHVDGITDGRLSGWGWRPASPSTLLEFDMWIDGDFVASVAAGEFRRDLADAGIRGGYAAFAFRLPDNFLDGREHVVTVQAPGTGWTGYTTNFCEVRQASLPAQRFGGGGVLFSGATWPQHSDAAAPLADAAVAVTEALNILDGFRLTDPPTIIIAVYNAADAVEACLAAVSTRTTLHTPILVIDDASDDPRIAGVLQEAARRDERIVLQWNATNQGYTTTINRAVKETAGDVVLLNSDATVPPRWLERLMAAAYRRRRIGTVTALSNNAGAFSVPEIEVDNRMPAHCHPDEIARAISVTSPGWNPSVPTGNGFCLFVKRALIEEIGMFDAASFPDGYGSENDFCVRALRRGWEHVVEDRTLVIHRRSASFGQRRLALVAAADERMALRHPHYGHLTRSFVTSPMLREIREAARRTLATLRERSPVEPPMPMVKPRILYVLHEVGGGGTGYTTFDLMREVSNAFACLALISNGHRVDLFAFQDGALQLRGSWTLNQPPRLFHEQSLDYAALLTTVLVREGIELVHLRHLLHHALEVPAIARALNIPVVLSFHDFYLVCPTINLLDEKQRYCGGVCTPGPGDCPTPMPWPAGMPPLKHRMIKEWRDQVRAQLDNVTTYVTTSESARRVVCHTYPELAAADFRLFEHGRDFAHQHRLADVPSLDRVIKILVLGHMTSLHKGGRLIKELHDLDVARRLAFHFLGNVSDEHRLIGECHGPYDREDLPRLVGEIRPSFILLPAIWPETYSHTLSEAWACGVPVIGPDLGAIGERIRRDGGGVLTAPSDAADVYMRIMDLARDPVAYEQLAARASIASVRTAAEMAQDYRALYKELMLRSQPVGVPATAVLRVAVTVPSTGGGAPSARLQARWLRALNHPALSQTVDVLLAAPGALTRMAGVASYRAVIAAATGDAGYGALLSRLRSSGATVLCDAALPPVCCVADAPVQYWGRLGHRLIDGEADPIEDEAGLIDERPWLWAANRLEQRARALHVSRRPPQVLVSLGGEGVTAELQLMQALAGDAVRQGCNVTVVAPAGTRTADWVNLLEIPTDLVGHAELAVWLADALPPDLDFACTFTGSTGRHPHLGVRHLALLGLPLILPERVAAELIGPDGSAVMSPAIEAAPEWLAWITGGADCIVEAEPARDAVLRRWSLRHHGPSLLRWLSVRA